MSKLRDFYERAKKNAGKPAGPNLESAVRVQAAMMAAQRALAGIEGLTAGERNQALLALAAHSTMAGLFERGVELAKQAKAQPEPQASCTCPAWYAPPEANRPHADGCPLRKDGAK